MIEASHSREAMQQFRDYVPDDRDWDIFDEMSRGMLSAVRPAGSSCVIMSALLAISLEEPLGRIVPVVAGALKLDGEYVLLYAMALTSNDASQRAMGIWWKRLHTVGIHWLWFIFTFSYFGRIMDPARMAQGLIFFPICIAALGLRLAAWSKARRKRVAV